MTDPNHVIRHKVLEIELGVLYEERPIQILDQKDKELRNRKISMV